MGLIEKLQVLKMLDDMKNGLNQNRCENEVVFLEILKKKIEGLEGVKSESGWIPCSKKMPEPYDEEKVNPVLATYESVFDGTPMTSEQAVVYLGEGEWVLMKIKNFSENLKRFREDRGLTQKMLAEKIFISKSTIQGYETQKSEPTLQNLIDIATVFDVSLDELVFSEIEEKKQKPYIRA